MRAAWAVLAAGLVGCGAGSGDPASKTRPSVTGPGPIIDRGGAGAAAVPWSPTMQEAATGEVAFALDLYGRMREREKGNVFFSPYSIHAALALTASGAAGPTRDQLAKALRLPAGDDGPGVAGDLGRYYAAPRPEFTLAVANAAWGQAGWPWKPEWQAEQKERFGGGFQPADFRTAANAERGRINGWVAGQTRGKIPALLQPTHVTEQTRFVLTNAVYFEGKWASAFKKADTRDEPFHAPTGAVPVPLMHQKGNLRYAEGDGVQVLEMPYRGGELSMLVILPAAKDGLAAVEAKLTPELLAGWAAKLSPELVEVAFPRFKSEFRSEPLPLLRAMGVDDATNPAKADFGRMFAAKPPEPVAVGAVVHQAVIEVDEEGTVAAAATAVVGNAPSPPPPRPKTFRADRPFVYLIRDTHKGTILFLGRMTNPK